MRMGASAVEIAGLGRETGQIMKAYFATTAALFGIAVTTLLLAGPAHAGTIA